MECASETQNANYMCMKENHSAGGRILSLIGGLDRW